MFLRVLAQVRERFNWAIHAYCQMGNHYHLLIETPDGNLSKGMRQLNGVYTQNFNRAHGRVGHVFQGRYKALIVQKETYLRELARYIVLNPVRAGMVRSAREWRWSSYRATAGQCDVPNWLHIDWILLGFSNSRSEAQARYRKFVAEGKKRPSPWDGLKNQIYLGSAEFVEQTKNRLAPDKDLSEIPSVQRLPPPKPLADYAHDYPDRDAAIVAAYASGGYTMKEVGEYFGLHYSRISRIVKKADVGEGV
jgi:REP element-mobilizing transposase RayT